jgi:hypothetical protein
MRGDIEPVSTWYQAFGLSRRRTSIQPGAQLNPDVTTALANA